MAKQPVQFPFNGGPQQGGVSTLPFKLFFATLPLSTTKAQVHNCHFPICGSRFYFLSSDSIVRVLSLSLSLSCLTRFHTRPFSLHSRTRPGLNCSTDSAPNRVSLWLLVQLESPVFPKILPCRTDTGAILFSSILFLLSLSLFSFCFFVRRMIWKLMHQ